MRLRPAVSALVSLLQSTAPVCLLEADPAGWKIHAAHAINAFWLSSRANVSPVTAQSLRSDPESVCRSASGNDLKDR